LDNYLLVVILVNTQNSCNAEAAQKILSSVPYDRGFHFFMPDGHYTGETAMSLCSFLRDLRSVDVQSIKFHFDRGDFQKWIRNTVGDQELAEIIEKLDKKIPEEKLGEKLADTVQKRISELQLTK
jgi:alpha-amylase